MDDLISKLRARAEKLTDELTRVQDAISKAEAAYAQVVALVDSLELVDVSPSVKQPMPADSVKPPSDNKPSDIPQKRVRGPNGSSPEEIANAVETLMREHGKPMTRFELIGPIEKLGLVIGGFDKPRNVGTILWRSGRFTSTGEGYWPSNLERPSAASNAPASASLDFDHKREPAFSTAD